MEQLKIAHIDAQILHLPTLVLNVKNQPTIIVVSKDVVSDQIKRIFPDIKFNGHKIFERIQPLVPHTP